MTDDTDKMPDLIARLHEVGRLADIKDSLVAGLRDALDKEIALMEARGAGTTSIRLVMMTLAMLLTRLDDLRSSINVLASSVDVLRGEILEAGEE